MATLLQQVRKIKSVVFDRIMHAADDPQVVWNLAITSKEIPKNNVVVVVDSDLAYGNARALAVDLKKTLSNEEMIFIAHNDSGLEWAKNQGLKAEIFSTRTADASGKLWDTLLRAKVSVYDTHNWWRTYDEMVLRALLNGSFKIQLWHGATGPVGKVFGLERLDSAPSWWHFVAVATSSGSFDVLVNEPSQAEYRRDRSMIATHSVHDIEYRLVKYVGHNHPIGMAKRILIAPTYSESVAGEDVLINWVKELASIALRNNIAVDVAVHPGAKPRVSRKLSRAVGVSRVHQGISTAEMIGYSAVVTDFSGIAHDSIMCNVPTISVLIDFDKYTELCPSLIDAAQMKVAYVVSSTTEFEKILVDATGVDSLKGQRMSYVQKVIEGLGNAPGKNTVESVIRALNS